MNYLISVFILFFGFSSSLFAQSTSVKEFDKSFKKSIKHKVTRFETEKKDELLSVYVFKTDKRIFSIMKRNVFRSNKKADSLVAYQFGYINDTLLRVWINRSDPGAKRSGVVIAYISDDKVIAIEKSGNIDLPSVVLLKEKSKELIVEAEEFLKTINQNRQTDANMRFAAILADE